MLCLLFPLTVSVSRLVPFRNKFRPFPVQYLTNSKSKRKLFLQLLEVVKDDWLLFQRVCSKEAAALDKSKILSSFNFTMNDTTHWTELCNYSHFIDCHSQTSWICAWHIWLQKLFLLFKCKSFLFGQRRIETSIEKKVSVDKSK